VARCGEPRRDAFAADLDQGVTPAVANQHNREQNRVMSRLGVIAAVLVAFGCAPPPTAEGQLPEPTAKDVWVLLVHGSGDGPERWATGLADTLRSRLLQPERVELVSYDWRAAAADKLSAAGNGRREGQAIAAVIATRSLHHVHVIAHSAGAHLAYGLETALAEQATRPTLHLTLLDPFEGEGLDFEWGVSRFGTKADFTDAVLNRGDGVPGTEVPIHAAHTFDVTASKPEGATWSGTQGHWWPTTAYGTLEPGFALSFEASGTFDVEALRASWPAGAVESR
jgi:pimeloyl-ACP methyl ester carboxylesterase